MHTTSIRPSALINDLELLHAGLGVLIAHYLACDDDGFRNCLALRISRQLRIISEHRDVPDRGLRPLYRTMAARWHVRAVREPAPSPHRPASALVETAHPEPTSDASQHAQEHR